ncbi:cell division protein ZapB [Candidatus Sumerlaeota bacterium]|nr:cell division protein ZapB [Candidatus Sumerlaeota bacterium]
MMEQLEQLDQRVRRLLDRYMEQKIRVDDLEKENAALKEQIEQTSQQSAEFENKESAVKNKLNNLLSELDAVDSEIGELLQDGGES